MSDPAPRSGRGWLWAALLLTGLKLWLVSGQAVYALGVAGHDDRLFLRLAEALSRGEWLGTYDVLTLAKGAGYPLWIAALHALGVPLFLAQHLLYAAACALVVLALRPVLASPAGRALLYLLLLWNPMSYDASSLGRVLRQQVHAPVALLILAGLAALACRPGAPWRRLAPWAVGLGLALGAFHLIREESIVLLPAVLLLAGAALVTAARTSRAALVRTAQALALALGCALVPVAAVSALNLRHYGWFGTVETRAGELRDAYGALLRIEAGADLPRVPVTRADRLAAYAASPAAAELRSFLEGDLGRGWAEASTAVTGRPPEEGEIGGGWFLWALRDAVAAAGHAGSAREALAYYRRLADELNAAAAAGTLPAGPARSGFAPKLRPGELAAVMRTWLSFAGFTSSFNRFSAHTPPSEGTDEDLALFHRLTGGRLAPTADGRVFGPDASTADRIRVRLLDAIGRGLSPLLQLLILVAPLVALIRAGQLLRRRDWNLPLTCAVAAGGSAAAFLLAQAVVEVTSYPVLVISSFAPVYPLLLLGAGVVLVEAAGAWAPARPPAAPPVPAWPGLAWSPAPAAPHLRWLPWVAGGAALLPLALWPDRFAELFWFADDLFLVDQIAQMGFWSWTVTFFTESFVPVFKLAWGGLLHAAGGSYFALIAALWVTHALNTVLFGRLLLRAGFPVVAVLFAQLGFALTVLNLETLGWSVQWSALLATTFLLLGLGWQESRGGSPGWSWRRHGPLVLCAALSAGCFARGVLSGGVFALGLLLPALLAREFSSLRRAAPAALLCLLPAAAVALGITLLADGNPRHMDGQWGSAARFAATFFLLNPAHGLLGDPAPWSAPSILLALLKLAVVASGLRLARDRVRVVLLLLFAYDLGNAVLLGIGRHHTGLEAALGSRYQYGSLLATLPFAGLLLARGLAALPSPRTRQRLAFALLALLAALWLRQWPAALAPFVAWRGTEMRQLLSAPYTTDPTATVPALDFMHLERAKALQRAYDLH